MHSKMMDSIKNTLTMESEALLELRDSLDQDTLEQVIGTISDCKGKVLLSGCGTSGAAAKKIAHTLCCINCAAVFLPPSDALHGGLGMVQEGDLLILLSKGGQTMEINSMLAPAKQKHATVIGVTEGLESELARGCDLLIQVKTSREPDDFDMLATSSTLAVVALFDAIAIAITRTRGYSREAFAVIHPGGAVGRRLTGMPLFEK